MFTFLFFKYPGWIAVSLLDLVQHAPGRFLGTPLRISRPALALVPVDPIPHHFMLVRMRRQHEPFRHRPSMPNRPPAKRLMPSTLMHLPGLFEPRDDATYRRLAKAALARDVGFGAGHAGQDRGFAESPVAPGLFRRWHHFAG